ncbi:hypothetical protein [Acutalibacter muris]|uniref:hypothetical protein n=1 Tax=Acutalibacter muris TaxID=1796620 RepID=UPI00272B82C1|nr:hypothetical protein [Acutalibacter muris]
MTMTAECVRPADLGERIRERAAAILDLNQCRLSLDWLKEYPLPKLREACGRIAGELPENAAGLHVQRELIRNPAFARYLARLLPLLPEEAPPGQKQPVHPARRNAGYAPKTIPTYRSGPMLWLDDFVKACQDNHKDPAGYELREVVEALGIEGLDGPGRLCYLENFAPMVLTHEQQGNAINSLRQCVGVPVTLTQEQQEQLLEPYTPACALFRNTGFSAVWELLERCPGPRKILRLLHERQIEEGLGMAEYTRFAEAPEEYLRLLAVLADRLSPAAAARFLHHWQRDGCSLEALRKMARHVPRHPDMDWEEALHTYSGYVNLVAGVKFKNLNLATVPQHLEDLLLYAMAKGKGHFLRLVDGNAELLRALPGYSFLLQERLYQEHLNLNEITEKDLADCAWMRRPKLEAERLAPGRRYTFPELRALYGIQRPYMDFYHALESESQDYRLRVFKEVCKREALRGIDGDSIEPLARLLDKKPLSVWKQELFSHIDGLTPADAARLLIHLDAVRRLLPSMRTRSDALLALRNINDLARFSTMDQLKEHIPELDAGWSELAKAMGLSVEFQAQYRETLLAFLGQDGASIALEYLPCLDESHKAGYLRVVKAELMGRLREVKYHDGDLRRELDISIPRGVGSRWPENLAVTFGGVEAREHDGFFDTMLLGTQPQRTCLSYLDGTYRNCLLSAFDSNKKVLYARLEGRIIGRAFLRLTKCRRTSAGGGGLSFADLEAGGTSQPEQTGEQITLFLERPYISGAGPEAKEQAVQALVGLAKRKAEELGVLLVLSQDYGVYQPRGFTQTRLHVYISKSKGGAQYLDSLDGEAAVSKEGSYLANRFLIQN